MGPLKLTSRQVGSDAVFSKTGDLFVAQERPRSHLGNLGLYYFKWKFLLVLEVSTIW